MGTGQGALSPARNVKWMGPTEYMEQSVICKICNLYVRTRTYILRGTRYANSSSICAVLHATGDDPMREFTRAAVRQGGSQQGGRAALGRKGGHV